MNIPLVRPAPPQLSLALAELKALEESGIFSNFGPVNTLFEKEMMARFFAGEDLHLAFVEYLDIGVILTDRHQLVFKQLDAALGIARLRVTV